MMHWSPQYLYAHPMNMRFSILLVSLSVLFACTSNPSPEVPAPDAPTDSVATTPEIPKPTAVGLLGYYSGSDGSASMNISLWLRDDSTYIRQEGAPDQQPQGAIGVWSMQQGKVILNVPEGKQHWVFNATEQTLRTEGADLIKVEWSKVTEYPEMRLKGAYSYMADAPELPSRADQNSIGQPLWAMRIATQWTKSPATTNRSWKRIT